MTFRERLSRQLGRKAYWLGPLVIVALIILGHRWVMAPIVNTNPTKKVVVRGVFPYDRAWDLRIKTSFYTENPTCKVTARAFFLFPMADVSREVWVDIPLIREGGNRYSFTYYEDHVQTGFCNWKQRFVYSQLFQDGKWQSGASAILGLNGRYNKINYDCHYIDLMTPGLGKGTREKRVVCGEHKEMPSRHDLQIVDNEVNFIWRNVTLFDRFSSSGKREMVWIGADGNEIQSTGAGK